MSCRLNLLKTNLKNNWAMLVASMDLEQGARITPFVRPWSTMTITGSNPEDGGRLVIRSMDSCLKGRRMEDGMEESGGIAG